MAIFVPKPCVNPFDKTCIFQSFELVFFIAQKGDFSCQNIVKDIFVAFIAFKNKLQKWPFLDQNHCLTPSKRCEFLNFLNFFFYSLERRFFVLKYRKRHFPGLSCLKKKLEKWPFLDQNHWVNPFEKLSIFRLLNFLFLQPRKAIFRSRIS